MIPTVTATSTRRKVKYQDESDNNESDNFKEEVMPLKRKVTVLRKMMILKMVKRVRVVMIETLMSQRSFMKHGITFLHPLMRVKLWKSGFQEYMKQKEAKDYAYAS